MTEETMTRAHSKQKMRRERLRAGGMWLASVILWEPLLYAWAFSSNAYTVYLYIFIGATATCFEFYYSRAVILFAKSKPSVWKYFLQTINADHTMKLIYCILILSSIVTNMYRTVAHKKSALPNRPNYVPIVLQPVCTVNQVRFSYMMIFMIHFPITIIADERLKSIL